MPCPAFGRLTSQLTKLLGRTLPSPSLGRVKVTFGRCGRLATAISFFPNRTAYRYSAAAIATTSRQATMLMIAVLGRLITGAREKTIASRIDRRNRGGRKGLRTED